MIDHLVACIEAKLGWGKGTDWSNRDFEELSEQIFNTTRKRLSVTTLKRIWGRAERIANPSSGTLDILSEFLGHESWRVFVQSKKSQETNEKVYKKPRASKIWIPILGVILVTSLILSFWKTTPDIDKIQDPLKSEDFVFKSRPVSEGIPNSVVFDYDASAAPDGSKIEIQQYWDETKRMAVNKNDSVATSIYFHPGFFKSKLLVDETIVRENDVFITTQDWLGLIEHEPRPIYLDKSDILKNDRLAITAETVASYNLDPRISNVIVSLYQVRDFGELYTDDFEMTATLKNDFKEGASACEGAQLLVLYDGGAIGIPLAKKGCASDLTLMTFDGFVDGKKNDLSGFGVDFDDYVNLKCISKNHKLDIAIDGKSVYQMNVLETAKKIKGIVIHFEGAGSVKKVEFKKNDQTVYVSAFGMNHNPK